MASLMNIPYFKELVEQNGEEWLESIFELLETDSYDFSQFVVPDSVALSIDEAIELDIADLDVEVPDSVTSDVSAATVAEKKIAANENDSEGRDDAANRAAAFSSQAPETAKDSAEAEQEPTSTDGGIKFDNAERENVAYVDYNSETLRRYLYQWRAMFNPDTSYSAHNAEEAVVVGLNGLYSELKLSAFDDKIYTAGGTIDATVSAGDGSDTLYLTTGGLKADLSGTSDFGKNGGKVTLRSVENVVGSDGDDTIFGNDEANKLAGRGGNDKIDGGGGDDTITGGGGDNNLSGGAGVDTMTGGNGEDVIDGGAGNDNIKSGSGNDKISGGAGDDTIDAANGADIIDGGEGTDTLTGGEGDDDISGDEGNDIIKADAGKDTVDGGVGNDTVNGGEDDDKIAGGDGDDTLSGDAGKDTIDGGAGNDTIKAGADDDKVTGGDGDDTLNGEAGNDTIEGGKGKDTIHGDDGTDTLKGDDGADKLFGDGGNDTIDGGADADEINGGDGDDTVTGGDGDDTLLGGAGKDKIDGGAGVDKITGGTGADTLTGGAGADTYIYLSKDDSGTTADSFDIITDFDVATDKVDLAAILASDTFDFISTEGGAFTGTGAEVRWDKDGGKTFIEIDVDGNGTADMKIELDDSVDLTASNFNL